MAKGKITTYTADEAVNVNMGQIGSAYIDDTSGSVTPPSGCVIVAIQILATGTKLDVLTAEDSSRWVNNSAAAHSNSAADGLRGTGGETYAVATTLYPGMTIYGRYTAVSTSAGAIIVYFGK